ncbi:biotin biosynthesis cytochrome P450 [Kutzneria viridogrisea]
MSAMTRQAPRRFDLRGWSAEDLANPYPIYRHYRETDPVHLGPANASGTNTWFAFRYDDVTSVLSNRCFGRGDTQFSSVVPTECAALRRIVSNWLVFLDPPRHTRLRSLLTREFSPQVVTTLRPRVAAIARELATAMASSPTVDLVADFAAPLPILVICELLGVPRQDRIWLRKQAMSLQQASSGRSGNYAEAETAACELSDYFRREVQRRRREPREDLIALLVRAKDRGGSLTDDELIATCVHLLTAGHETTTNLISKSVLALLRTPEVLGELRANPELMPVAVDELIRYDPPVQMVTRWAQRDQVLRGRSIHRGEKLVLVLGSANRDPLLCPDPDVVRLDRRPNRHCGFGIGIHHCLGSALARAETEIGLNELFRQLPGLHLTDEPVQFAPDVVFHGPERLTLTTCAGGSDA